MEYVNQGGREFSRLLFCFQAEDGIRDSSVTGVQTCALPIYVREREARFLQAITDRLPGKSRRVFHAVEAFFLDRGDEPAVADNRRRSVSVVRIDPKNIHLASCQCTSAGRLFGEVSAAPLVQDIQRPRA